MPFILSCPGSVAWISIKRHNVNALKARYRLLQELSWSPVMLDLSTQNGSDSGSNLHLSGENPDQGALILNARH